MTSGKFYRLAWQDYGADDREAELEGEVIQKEIVLTQWVKNIINSK